MKLVLIITSNKGIISVAVLLAGENHIV